MNVLVELFLIFAKLYPFSFGGGVVMLPSMMQEMEARGLATAAELTDVVAIASMSPGSMAINAALGMGYHIAGLPGAFASFLGIVIPTAVLVIFAATFFFKVYNHPKVQAAFYGLRPVITGIILYAATSLAFKNGIIAATAKNLIITGINISALGIKLFELKSLVIVVVSFLLLAKTKTHPIIIIICSGILGVLIF